MPKIIFLVFGLLAAFLMWSRMINSVKNNEKEVDEESPKNSKTEYTSESENDVNQNIKMDMELKKFTVLEDISGNSSNRKYENLVEALDNYIHRYTSLFLITTNLVEYPIKDFNEVITIDLEITISGEDLAHLQEFSKSGKDSNYIKSLSKLDAIFSKIARLKQRSYMENAFRYHKSFFTTLMFSMFNNPSFQHYLPFLIIFIVILLIYNFILYKPYVCAGIFINSLIVWDSLNLYWKRMKEVDVDIYVKTLQFKDIPADCDPSNMRWYQQVLSAFTFQNRCLQYFKNINKNPVEEVSVLKCIIDTYGFYFIQTPIRIFGASIRDYIGEISQLWPWPLNYILSVPLAPFFTVVAVVVILILCGKRLKLSFFGATVELSDVKPPIASETTAAVCDSASEAVRPEVRKLRPWTRVRFPKRLERDYVVRKRLLLKVVKSLPGVPENVLMNAPDFSEKLNAEDPNVKPNDNIIEHD